MLDYDEAKRVAKDYLYEPEEVDFSNLEQSVISECSPMVAFAQSKGQQDIDHILNVTFGVDAKVITAFIDRYKNQTVGDPTIDEMTFKTLGLKLLSHMAGIDPDNEINLQQFSGFLFKRLYAFVNADTGQSLFYNQKDGLFCSDELAFSRICYFYYTWLSNGRAVWADTIVRSVRSLIELQSNMIDPEDINGNFLVCVNGDLDLATLSFSNHSPNNLMTIGNDVYFDENAKAPIFKATLKRVLPDPIEREFILEFFGYVLGTSMKANKFLIAVGDGATGKSTVLNPLMDLVGVRNVTSVPLNKLSGRFGLESLVNKRLNMVTESDTFSSVDVSSLKNMTAGEVVNVDRKNKAEITTRIIAKHIFVVNNTPTFTDKTNGLARRVIVLPFTQRIETAKQDKDLSIKLHAEASGILNLALEGLKRLRKNGYNFSESEAMKATKKRLLSNQTPIDEFTSTQLEVADGYRQDANELREKITQWFGKHNYQMGSLTSPRILWPEVIASAERTLGITIEKGSSNGRTIIRNVKLLISDDVGDSEAKIIEFGGRY